MKNLMFATLLVFCVVSIARANDEFFTRPIVVPVPQPGEVKVHRDLEYLETAEGRTLADIFLPPAAGEKNAAVIFIHGGPIPKDVPAAKDWMFFQSYGSLATSAGLAAGSEWDPAFFIAEAGLDNAALNAGLRAFSHTALKNGWKIEYWNHPTGPHGFDLDQDDQRSREIILRTVDFVRGHLDPESEQ